MGINKTCDSCFYQKLCNTYAKFGVTDLGSNDKAVCDFYKDKSKIKEVPCTCEECGYSKSLATRVGPMTSVKIFCTRCYNHPMIVNPEGFCSYGKRKESVVALQDDR